MLKDYFPGEYAEPEENTAPANPIYTVKPGIPIIWFDDDDYGVIDPRWTIPWSPILPGDGNDGEMNPIEAIPVDKLPVDALPGDGDDGDDQMNPIDAAPADGWYIEGMKWAYDNIEQKRNLIAGAAVSTDDDMNVVMEYAPASVMAEVKPRDQYAVVNPDGEITGKVSYAEGDLYSKADTEKADAAVFGAEGDAALVGNEGEFEITVTRKNGDELVSVFGHADGDVAARPTAEGIELIAPAGIYTVTFEGDTEKMVTVASEGGKVSVSEDGAVEVPEVVPVTPESELPFTDVKATDWFYNAVKYVYENGLMSGTSETTFSPAATTSRGMITSILWRMEGRPYAENALPFTDVKADAYYAEAIAWAAEEGIVSGYGDTFGPDDNITREQLASILWRYAKYKGYDVSVGEDTNILSYTDAFDISEYAIPAMQWACGDGIISGNDDGTLNPKGHAQRSHAAQMLMKFMKNTVE